MMKLFVWSKNYKADMGEHIFPTEKHILIKEKAIKEGIAKNRK